MPFTHHIYALPYLDDDAPTIAGHLFVGGTAPPRASVMFMAGPASMGLHPTSDRLDEIVKMLTTLAADLRAAEEA